MSEQSTFSRLVPLLVLLVLLALIGVGWLAFPRIQAWLAYQDCIAVGRTACG